VKRSLPQIPDRCSVSHESSISTVSPAMTKSVATRTVAAAAVSSNGVLSRDTVVRFAIVLSSYYEAQVNTRSKYIHAMGHRGLTPLYDPFVRLFMREKVLRRRLIESLPLQTGGRMLDVGCGTGTLAVWTKRQFPRADVTGIDGDGDIIERARQKAADGGESVRFEVAVATAIPFADHSFDCVTSTFVMHHLPTAQKQRCFEECHRVLQSGGQIHVVDFGSPRGNVGRSMMSVLRGMAYLADNLDGRLPGMLRDAGFLDVREADRVTTAFGPAVFLSGRRGHQALFIR
jgi:ubiquinone/menaquinone biosynthesis C-methylase UbiE